MSATRNCKVCGVAYPYCRTDRPVDNFRWQDVACSPEHAEIYFEEVRRAREGGVEEVVVESEGAQENVIFEPIEEEEYEDLDDEDDDDWFDDEDDEDDDDYEKPPLGKVYRRS